MILIGIILKINQIEPTKAPLIPASAGVEDEKLVKIRELDVPPL